MKTAGVVHAFISLDSEKAREHAGDVDKQIAAGEDPGPLAGIPFTVKDIFCVKDTPSTAGSRILANFISPYTATPVERMLNAGGISLGKVNLDEFTYGSSNESSAFQPVTAQPMGYQPGCRADLQAEARLRWQQAKLFFLWARIPPAPSASRPLSAAWLD